MKFSGERLRLYAVTDRQWTGRLNLYQQVKQALEGGATLVQLREKRLNREELVREAVEMRELCHRYDVPIIINDDVEAALASGADGVHVGMADTPVREIRGRVPAGFVIGATAKTVEQARAAQEAGADYLGVGAVFPSPTKRNAIRITTAQLQEICASVSIPVVAIGGIGLENIDSLSGGGMAGVAVVSAVFGAEDIRAAAAALREKANRICEREGRG